MRMRNDPVNVTACRSASAVMAAGGAALRCMRLPRRLRAPLIAATLGCISALQVAAQVIIHRALTPAEALRMPAVSWRVPHTHMPPDVGRTVAYAGLQPSHVSGRQEQPERFRMLLPLIGAAAGAGVGYLYARGNDPPDTYVPAGLFSIPVGALAGFVVGIVAEDIRSQLKDDDDRER